jgi:hypothetical protein
LSRIIRIIIQKTDIKSSILPIGILKFHISTVTKSIEIDKLWKRKFL